jgi:hypothetical protein
MLLRSLLRLLQCLFIGFSLRDATLEEKADAVAIEITSFDSLLVAMSKFGLQLHRLEQLIFIKVLTPNGKRRHTK